MEKEMLSNRKFPLVFCTVFMMLFIALPLSAETDLKTDVQSETMLTLALSTRPEAKLTLGQSFTVPFLQGNNPLTQGNNIKFDLKAEITPIAMGLISGITWTPIAIFEVSAGGSVGSGWNVGDSITGIGLNVPKYDEDTGQYTTSVDGERFDGTFSGVHFGGAFQFNFGAIFPGDWNQVLLRSYHQMGHRTYSRAGPGDPWFFENDYGENQNGWRYNASYFIGYRMPLFLNTIGIMADMEKYLYDTPGGGAWGDSLARWDLGLLMNFTIIENMSAAVLTQFRFYRKYAGFTYYEDYRYYRHRELLDSNSRDFKFYRVELLINYKIK